VVRQAVRPRKACAEYFQIQLLATLGPVGFPGKYEQEQANNRKGSKLLPLEPAKFVAGLVIYEHPNVFGTG
jgi:hypothetical protein